MQLTIVCTVNTFLGQAVEHELNLVALLYICSPLNIV